MKTITKIAALAALTMAFGCSAAATTSTPASASSSEPALSTFAAVSGDEVSALEAPEPVAHHDPAALEGLPAAPWSADPVGADATPGPVLSAWATAENRASCAPLMPAALGAADGAEARVSDLVEGGWAVEFDRSGLPGLSESGRACTRCGRGVFGIAGTNLSPDALIEETSDSELPAPTFADGSHVAVEAPAEGESVAAATLTVGSSGCVYQVWSFLGEDHVRELVEGLRRVDVQPDAAIANLQ